MLGVCSLSVLGSCMNHRMVVRQWYWRRRRDLGLGLYICTTSDVLLDKVPNICDEGIERKDCWSCSPMVRHVERMENYRIAKRVYVREFAGSCLVGSQRKRWIDTVKDGLKKRGLDVRQARRLVHWYVALGWAFNFDEMLQLWVATAIWSHWRLQAHNVTQSNQFCSFEEFYPIVYWFNI